MNGRGRKLLGLWQLVTEPTEDNALSKINTMPVHSFKKPVATSPRFPEGDQQSTSEFPIWKITNINSVLDSLFLKLECAAESPGGLGQMQDLGPHPIVSDPVGLR